MEGTMGEIRMFAGDFAPKNWAFCQGQTMAISQNSALFSLLGTTYGGDGRTTFGLPNLGGRVAVGTGQAQGGSSYPLGAMMGSDTVTLTQNNMPAHSHLQIASGNEPSQNTASGAVLASNGRTTNPPMANIYTGNGNNPVALGQPTSVAGGSQPFSVVQPALGMNYIVCLYGVFPSRN